MRTTAYTLLFAIAAAVGAQQKPDSDGEIIRAALHFIQESRTYNPEGTVMKVDPRIFSRGDGFVPRLASDAPRHGQQTLSMLTKANSSEVVSTEKSERCGRDAQADCMSKGVSVVLSFSDAQIKQDSAKVDVFFRTSVYLPPNATRDQLLHRNGGTLAYVELARIEGKWVAVRLRVVSQT